MTVKRLTRDAIFLALLIVSAFTSVNLPISEITFTLQILVVFLIAILLPLGDAMYILIAYLAMGLIGIPVFSAGGGISYVFKPTFGYILGFIFVPLIIKGCSKLPLKWNIAKDVIGSILALAVVYIFGTVYFYLLKNVYGSSETIMSWKTIIGMCVTPFIPIDILKIAISLVVAYKLAPAIQLEEVKQKKEEHA